MTTERNPVDFDAWFDRWIDILGDLEDAAVRRHQEGHDEIPAYVDAARGAAFDHLDELRPLATGQQPSPPAAGQQPSPPAEQWEYRVVPMPKYATYPDCANVLEILAEAGDDGWELAAAPEQYAHFIFKRRKS